MYVYNLCHIVILVLIYLCVRLNNEVKKWGALIFGLDGNAEESRYPDGLISLYNVFPTDLRCVAILLSGIGFEFKMVR